MKISTAADLASRVATVLERFRKERIKDLEVSFGDIHEMLIRHHREVAAWVDDIRIEASADPRSVRDLFVDLDLSVLSRSAHSDQGPRTVSDMFRADDSVAVLGEPGAGKTTSLRRIAQLALEGGLKKDRVPILLRPRSFPTGAGIVDVLCGVFNLRVTLRTDHGLESDKVLLYESRVEAISTVFEAFPALVMLDGIDEFRGDVRALAQELEKLTYREKGRLGSPSRWVLTCRTQAYRVAIPRLHVYELQGLTSEQIEEVVRKWLDDENERREFLEALLATPYAGTAIRPLVLAALLLIYIRRGRIPDRPTSVYEKIVRLFLEDWDETRGVRRTSRYATFTVDRKIEFLEALAFHLFTIGRKGVFSHEDLVSAYAHIHGRFALPATEAPQVAREIASHTGLVLERGERFEFFHLTIQEYLAAMYLIRRGGHVDSHFRFHEQPETFAVAVARSSAPTLMFADQAEAYRQFRELVDRDYVDTVCLPFVGRLVSERPDWEVSPLLGAAFAQLFTVHSKVAEGEGADLWEEFAADPRVRSSITAFLDGIVVRARRRKRTVYLEIDDSTLEADYSGRVREFFRGRTRPIKLLLPRSVFDTIRPSRSRSHRKSAS